MRLFMSFSVKSQSQSRPSPSIMLLPCGKSPETIMRFPGDGRLTGAAPQKKGCSISSRSLNCSFELREDAGRRDCPKRRQPDFVVHLCAEEPTTLDASSRTLRSAEQLIACGLRPLARIARASGRGIYVYSGRFQDLCVRTYCWVPTVCTAGAPTSCVAVESAGATATQSKRAAAG